jgi:hypothetical protein
MNSLSFYKFLEKENNMRYNHGKFIEKLFLIRSENEQMDMLKEYMLSLPFEEFNRFIKWQSSDFRDFCEGLDSREDMSLEEKERFAFDIERLYQKAFSLQSSNQKQANMI